MSDDQNNSSNYKTRINELQQAIEDSKKEKDELVRHRKLAGQVFGRQLTQEPKKRNPFDYEKFEKLKQDFIIRYPDFAFENKNDVWPAAEKSVSEEIKERIQKYISSLEYLFDSLEKLTSIEQQLELNKPVYYLGKVGLLQRIYIYDEHSMDRIRLDDSLMTYAKNGDIIAQVIFSSRQGTEIRSILAKDLLPYNESTKLLYDKDKK